MNVVFIGLKCKCNRAWGALLIFAGVLVGPVLLQAQNNDFELSRQVSVEYEKDGATYPVRFIMKIEVLRDEKPLKLMRGNEITVVFPQNRGGTEPTLAKVNVVFSTVTFAERRHGRSMELAIVASSDGLRKIKSSANVAIHESRFRGDKVEQVTVPFAVTKIPSRSAVGFRFSVIDGDGKDITSDNPVSPRSVFQKFNFKNEVEVVETPPEPDQPPTAKKQTEDEFWKGTQETHTEDAYRRYKLMVEKRIFSGEYLDEANKQMRIIREDGIWRHTKEKNTGLFYEKYLQTYPDGRYVEEAKRRLNELNSNFKAATTTNREDSLWNEISKSGMEDLYKRYLIDYPDGKYQVEALSNIQIFPTMEKDKSDMSMATIFFSYVKLPLILTKVEFSDVNEGINEEFTPLNIEGEQQDNKRNYEWDEGAFSASISASFLKNGALVKLQTGKFATYKLHFEDSLGREIIIPVNMNVPPLDLVTIEGDSVDQDTLFLTITGGVEPYSIWLNDVDNDNLVLEAELKINEAVENSWFLVKSELRENPKIKDAVYSISIVDNLRLEIQQSDKDVYFPQDSFAIDTDKTWMFLLPIWIILLIWLLIRYRKKANPNFEQA